MGEHWQEKIINPFSKPEPTEFDNVYSDTSEGMIKVVAVGNEYWSAYRLGFLAAMALKVFREEVVANTQGRIVGYFVQDCESPSPILLDSNTEALACTTNVYIMLHDKWTKQWDIAAYLNKILVVSCDGTAVKDLLVKVDAEE
jgi:hypothetical protein